MQTRTLLPVVLVVTVVAAGCGGRDAKPTARMEVVGADDYCFGGPDCDEVPAEMPVPADAYITCSSPTATRASSMSSIRPTRSATR
ncbi:MAG: hypothetical protein QOC69_5580 [Mycobacterium sp.]|jgi:hypothetical protein|nr:hypothetical protein [Mycobacterium sp.]